MTEKRYYVDVDEAIIDSKTRRQYTTWDINGVEDIADKLNELYTSNLAQGEIISKQIKQIEALENDYFSIRDIASELKKENEQLQQRIKELELLNDGLNYALKYIKKIDVEIDVGDV